MKNVISLVCLIFCFALPAKADHITGGEMYYTLTGTSNGEYQYTVTLKLYMRCNSGRQFNNPTSVAIFNRGNNERVRNVSVALSRIEKISIANPDPCITNPPTVCYDVGFYEFTISLPPTPDGYKLITQVNFRIANIRNLMPGYSQIGASYTAEIPGTGLSQSHPKNSSAQFIGSDLVVVCAENSFTYSFAAKDDDGDELRYSFCNAYKSMSTANNAPPPSAVIDPVPYSPQYTGGAPLGSGVKINAATGLITGIAPATGIYVVTVCVQEVRNGAVIATQRKDLQINIAPCNIAAARLQPEYMLCKDTKTISVSNLSSSPLIQTYSWEFIDGNGTIISTSDQPNPTYTFPDTGLYTIKLSINRGGGCKDSTTSPARVYPGFSPKFNYSSICYKRPTAFTDATTSVYGRVNYWSWDFGEVAAEDDTSGRQNASYTYPSNGSKNVRLIAANTVGCRDTAYKIVSIVEKPPLNVAFADTLICVNDKLVLQAIGNGLFSWTPAVNMTNANTATPTVTPTSTQKYYVNLDDNGCLNKDSVLVRVTDRVNLAAMADTVVCQGDAIKLRIVSDGFKFSWTPSTQLNDPALKEPTATTVSNTTYEVTASIGGCTAKEQVVVATVPYPVVDAGSDTTICFNSFARLSATTNGSSYQWAPAAGLNNASILNPVARPFATTAYVFSATDTEGCPKPAMDTVVVTVLADISAFAGNDTSVIIGQPLQFNATGGTSYTWSPATGLSSVTIANPVGFYNQSFNGLRYKVLVYNEAGCVDSAYVAVRVFKTGPSIFVPTAFTPNADGRNDLLRPITAGIKQIEYFNVYNRWGQLVYRSQAQGMGWDGTIAGIKQGPGVFVWMVKAIDFNGKPYFDKGTVTLIR